MDEKKGLDDEEVTWQSLNLPHFNELSNGIASLQWKNPLDIQARTLPLILESRPRNLIAQAPTGKGKTGAFAIGMVCRCDPAVAMPQAICVAPTRELAVQTADKTLAPLAESLGMKVFKAVKDSRCDGIVRSQIVVGTAGTMIKMINEKQLRLDKVRLMVIDEADTMVQKDADAKTKKDKRDMTRVTLDIKEAAKRVNGGDLQILLFSATFDSRALIYARKAAPDAHEMLTQSEDDQHPVDNVKQYVFHCKDIREKLSVLEKFLLNLHIGNCIIFTNSRTDADSVCHWLQAKNFSVRSSHGGNVGEHRDMTIEDFREKKFTFLVTTQVLARGLDVPQVNFVVNLDLPRVGGKDTNDPDHREFIHRVGRAGRVDRKGIAVAFTDGKHDTKDDIKKLFGKYKVPVPFEEIDGDNVDKLLHEIASLEQAQS